MNYINLVGAFIVAHPLIIAVAYLLLPVVGKPLSTKSGIVGQVGQIMMAVGLNHWGVAAALVKEKTGMVIPVVISEPEQPK